LIPRKVPSGCGRTLRTVTELLRTGIEAMHRYFQRSHHHTASAEIEVPLPSAFPQTVFHTEYGDTPGSLGRHATGGDQSLPASLSGNPDLNYLTVFGDANRLGGCATGGDDTLSGSAGTVALVGDARLMRDHAEGGQDVIRAGNGFRAAVFGDAEIMAGWARGGDDDILGANGGSASRGNATNALYGDAYALSDRAEGGDDLVAGGGAYPGTRNLLYGDAHTLSGHARAGNDTIVSGSGANSEMWGDAAAIEGDCVTTGQDVFVIRPNSGTNLIHDFEPCKDVIDLTAYAGRGIHGFEDLQPLIEVTDGGSQIIFSRTPAGPVGPVVVNAVTILDDQTLTERDFLFA
jgi:hypothetical protein